MPLRLHDLKTKIKTNFKYPLKEELIPKESRRVQLVAVGLMHVRRAINTAQHTSVTMAIG